MVLKGKKREESFQTCRQATKIFHTSASWSFFCLFLQNSRQERVRERREREAPSIAAPTRPVATSDFNPSVLIPMSAIATTMGREIAE